MSATVLYHCTCTDDHQQQAKGGADDVEDVPPEINDAHAPYSFHPLSELYFCEECDRIECERCVESEIVSYFCPNCLFDVPTASVRSERYRCARKCLACPSCTTTLAIARLSSQAAQERHIDDGKLYYLTCKFCKWDSVSTHDMRFLNSSGIGLQVLRSEEKHPALAEFDQLRQRLHTYLRAQQREMITNIDLYQTVDINDTVNDESGSTSSTPTRSRRARVRYDVENLDAYKPLFTPSATFSALLDDEQPYSPSCIRSDKERYNYASAIKARLELGPEDRAARTAWYDDPRTAMLPPERVELHTKVTKRCRQCKQIVIQPDPRATSKKFKIKFIAAIYLPTITVTSITAIPTVDSEQSAALRSIYLRLHCTNPLYDAITVQIECVATSGIQANFPALAFSIAPLDDAANAQPMIRTQSAASQEEHFHVGILETQPGATVIGSRLSVLEPTTKNVVMNLLVTYTYQADDGAAGINDSASEIFRKFSFYVKVLVNA